MHNNAHLMTVCFQVQICTKPGKHAWYVHLHKFWWQAIKCPGLATDEISGFPTDSHCRRCHN